MLLKFELKKLIGRRSFWLLSICTLLVNVVLTLMPLLSAQYYTEDAISSGLQAIRMEKEITLENRMLLSDENVQNEIRQVQSLFKVPENTASDGHNEYLTGPAYWQMVAPKEDMLNLLARTYAPIGQSVDYSYLNFVNLETEPEFYQKIADQRELLLNAPDKGLSEKQKELWIKKAAKIQIPFEYSWFKGWSSFSSSMELTIITIILICLIIIPVFSQEYSSGMDNLLLGARYGKTRLVWAKIGAAYITGTGLLLINALVMLAINLFCYGTEGRNLPVQLANPFIPYPISFLQADLISLGLSMCVLWGMIGFTLFLSAALRGSYQSSLIVVLIGLIPIFLMPSSTAGVLNKILYLLPYQALIPDFARYLTFQFGEIVLDGITAKLLFYLILAGAFIPAAASRFRSHTPA